MHRYLRADVIVDTYIAIKCSQRRKKGHFPQKVWGQFHDFVGKIIYNVTF